MKLLLLSFVALLSQTVVGQQNTPITRAEFDALMAKAHERAAAREASPNRHTILTSSAFERTGQGIGRDTTTIDIDSAGSTRTKTVTYDGRNKTERDAITIGSRKWERVNGGPWQISDIVPRTPPTQKPYVNPYPETAALVESGSKGATRRFRIVFSKRARSTETSSEYTEAWTVTLILHQAELINMRQEIRASGPAEPTRTYIEHQFSWLPPFKIGPPASSVTKP